MNVAPYRLHFFPCPILTGRGIVILSGAVLLPLAALLYDIPLKVQLLLIGLYGSAFALFCLLDGFRAYRLARHLSPRLVLPKQLYSGITSSVRLDLRSDSTVPAHLALRLAMPLGLEEKELFSECFLPLKPDDQLPPFSVRPLQRGRCSIELVTGRLTLAPALCRWQLSFRWSKNNSTTVYPNDGFAPDDTLQAFQRQQQGVVPLRNALSEGREFNSLRTYTPGDDLRKVDWKRSAKANRLVLKTFEPETHQRINIALDCGRRMRNSVDGRQQLEHATDAAAHLLRVAVQNGDEVGLFAFDHQVISRFHCRRGRRHEHLVREALQELKTADIESDYQLLLEWVGMDRRRSLLVLITTLSNPAGLESIERALQPIRGRHLPIVFAIADRELDLLRFRSVNNLPEAYTIAAAVEQVSRIEQAAARLTRAGIETVYCDAAQLSERLRLKYLELKALGKL
ncbi:MAG: DUF58 domain-containing protein [Bdellovibrionales bacterium]|nr:DUF58 domain-containing protein [Bdellovibrionales bacterium]